MPDFTFRLRFLLAEQTAINVQSPEFELGRLNSGSVLILHSKQKNMPISESRELVLQSSGWPTEGDAMAAGSRCKDSLLLACARWRIGIDVGGKSQRFMFTRAGLEMLQQQANTLVVNDIHGLMAYPSEPKPRFASGGADYVVSTPPERFQTVFQKALGSSRDFTQRERLSFDLFNSSFFQPASDTRFLLLVISFETLLEPQLRPSAVLEHVKQLIASTRNATELPKFQVDSLLGCLNFLRYESIRQLGRRFASEKLGSRLYADRSPSDFFDQCYDLRSRLVHGSTPGPSDKDLGTAAASLEVFMSDLLCGDLMEAE